MDPREQLALARRGAVEVYTEEDLLHKLERSAKDARPLRVKLGVDPSSPDIHLGHTVVLRKLRHFQDLGHQAVLIIGDFTGLVGDPSGKSKTRPQLTPAEVEANAQTYFDQVGRILDMKKAEVVRNSSWLRPLNFEDILKIAAKLTVARMLERDDFQNRYKGGSPIGLHEFLYPMMQGYDSVAVRSDVELGGTDQTFNLLVGRNLQREWGQEPQIALTLPLLVGLDGKDKMSKSLGNHIGVADAPADMFGKAMSIPDDQMRNWYTLLTDFPEARVAELLAGHPREAKATLAAELVRQYHGAEAATGAREGFDKVFARKEVPDEVAEVAVPAADLQDGTVWLPRLLGLAGFSASNSEARRLISQGGVSIDGQKCADPNGRVPVVDGMLLKSGKRHFARVRAPKP
ncbi:MAG: tyrosine--tRNA ligase [Planctomycetes bacterium]|nr:tyrosine--tRNA ligase [Planctomycetota bacterium]